MDGFPFVKMHSGGNDFVVIDATSRRLPANFGEMASHIASRRMGIGCDQILILHKSRARDADFDYRIINADGGEVAQCGNGARCVHAFLRRRIGLKKKRLRLRTSKTLIVTEDAEGDGVRAYLAKPKFKSKAIHSRYDIFLSRSKRLRTSKTALIATEDVEDDKVRACLAQPETHLCNEKYQKNFFSLWCERNSVLIEKIMGLSLGNPHLVCFCQEIDDQKILEEGGFELNEGRMFPEGVNVGFCRWEDGSALLRVYERGAGVTPSCGSAAAAAAVAIISRELAKGEVRVRMTGGELLCGWDGENSPAWVQGPVAFSFDGTFPLDGAATIPLSSRA